ncbi:MAG: HAD hydrolase family protein, partial [Lachnospiraceae bacterium]|nr:HAD hydrolase family protein [Lachnospiraceae bacterium]
KVTFAGHQWVDVFDPALNKGVALKTLKNELGILPEETMVFGDQMNDMEMLEQAYYSFAVANARAEVKEAARFMADSNVEQGPMKIMKLLLKETGT